MDNLPPKEIADEDMINQAFQQLLNDYLSTKHRKKVEIITKAFNFANQAHKGIKRRSGEPYIMHPIAVASIVCNEIGLGSTSICAALLHDVVEDTDYTVEDIENIFGPKIAQIVDGLTKISGGIFGDRASAQAENFKKLLLTMSNDIRVILIKIADRLHNMRTLGSMLPNKQYKIAGETLYIYAPLANRLGLYKIKTELENLSFKYEHPEEYAEIEEKLNATAAERDKVFNDFTAPIRTQLDKMGLKYRILARVKSIYSIWNKMQTKHVPFEEIYDLLAVRIIFEPRNMEEELNDCFDIYVSISKIYKPHPDRLRDWVSHPKANGYQALHVTLMGNNGQWIEVQIRSERMNDVAEQGFAAHWKYKEGGTDKGFLEVSPEKMRKSSYVPPIVFTGLKIQGHLTDHSIDNLEELELEPSQRNVTFQFAALDYVNPKGILYAYRLQGLEEEWNEADNNRSASYINLPAGKYQLQVKSTNSDGVWVDNVQTLSIHVLPTFWETYWAWLFYFILFILFTASIVYVLFYIYRLRHRVDMEQQLANIKLRFFTDISHELRTPLTLISSPVTEVLENEPLSPSAREHLTLVHQNTERMLRLMNQILDFRKIQNQKMKLLIEETDLIPLLQKVMSSFKLIAEEKNINYQLTSTIQSVYSWVDRDKFEKIFFNLLSNAFKYTPADKSITVNITTKEKTVEIEVADEGIGIAVEKQHSLFQRFESLVKQNILQPSSGIGLSLVKEMVEMHHGTITVNSQPGIGSRFTVSLPLQREIFEEDVQVEFILNDSQSSAPHPVDSMKAPEEVEEKEDLETNSDGFSILVVEDNEELKAFLKSILSENYTVITASNGEEGLQHAVDDLPDLIISDVMMPVMDGLEMIRQIKENNNICHIPIIVLSAKASLDDRIAGLEQGIDDYITKPFSATYLKTRVASLLRQRKALQELYMNRLMEGKNTSSPDPLTPSQPQITPYDEQFMKKVMAYMEEQMDNAELTIDEFAEQLMLSRTIFYRKLKSIVGLTPVDFIREIRIKRAVQLIDSDEYNFSQVAYMTGFNDPKYFSKCFKKVIGITPSEYKERKK